MFTDAPERPEYIGEARASAAPGAASYWQAGLFRLERAGVYLLAGTGGAQSQFATAEGRSGRVIKMTETEAFSWAQSFLPHEALKAHFAHMGAEPQK